MNSSVCTERKKLNQKQSAERREKKAIRRMKGWNMHYIRMKQEGITDGIHAQFNVPSENMPRRHLDRVDGRKTRGERISVKEPRERVCVYSANRIMWKWKHGGSRSHMHASCTTSWAPRNGKKRKKNETCKRKQTSQSGGSGNSGTRSQAHMCVCVCAFI